MDLDRFIARHRPGWDRLDALLRAADRRPGKVGAADLTRIVRLYLRVSSHLSTARTTYGDAALTAELSRLVSRAHAFVYGTRARTWRTLGVFVTRTFPAAVWHARRPVAVSAAVFLTAFAAIAIWIAGSPAALEAVAPPDVRAAYLEEDFEAYYSSQPAGQFAALVFTNNARVGLQAFAFGIGLCLPTLAVLVGNGANLGLAAGLFHAAGHAPRFWGLILPHGLLELTAVFVAGGAGLRLGWALIAPGERTRPAALAEEGRRAVVIVLGLVLVFLVAGVVEAFVTPSPLPTWARVGVGVVAEACFVAYVVVRGRAAAALGLTGALGEEAQSRPVALTSR